MTQSQGDMLGLRELLPFPQQSMIHGSKQDDFPDQSLVTRVGHKGFSEPPLFLNKMILSLCDIDIQVIA